MHGLAWATELSPHHWSICMKLAVHPRTRGQSCSPLAPSDPSLSKRPSWTEGLSPGLQGHWPLGDWGGVWGMEREQRPPPAPRADHQEGRTALGVRDMAPTPALQPRGSRSSPGPLALDSATDRLGTLCWPQHACCHVTDGKLRLGGGSLTRRPGAQPRWESLGLQPPGP